jgi:REP element-mobilizing transposase RayT
MARPLRLEFAGAVYHLTARGNGRAAIYRDDADRTLFLRTLAETIDRRRWACHAFCLMTNHYHLLLETPAPALSRGMRDLDGIYGQAFNRRHRHPGHVFQGRFKAMRHGGEPREVQDAVVPASGGEKREGSDAAPS